MMTTNIVYGVVVIIPSSVLVVVIDKSSIGMFQLDVSSGNFAAMTARFVFVIFSPLQLNEN